MTDALYFEPKVMPDHVALLRQGLITIQEYDEICGGKWSRDAIQAAADLVGVGLARYDDFRRYVLKADPISTSLF